MKLSASRNEITKYTVKSTLSCDLETWFECSQYANDISKF